MAQLSSRYICLSHIGHSSWNFKVTISLTLNISCKKLCDLVPFHPLRHIYRVSVNLRSCLQKAQVTMMKMKIRSSRKETVEVNAKVRQSNVPSRIKSIIQRQNLTDDLLHKSAVCNHYECPEKLQKKCSIDVPEARRLRLR